MGDGRPDNPHESRVYRVAPWKTIFTVFPQYLDMSTEYRVYSKH